MSAATIAVDAMGGDRAPAETVAGAVEAAPPGRGCCSAARRRSCEQELAGHGDVPGIEIVDAPGVIDFHDEPVAAVRSRPDSSMVTACRLVREGRAAGRCVGRATPAPCWPRRCSSSAACRASSGRASPSSLPALDGPAC